MAAPPPTPFRFSTVPTLAPAPPHTTTDVAITQTDRAFVETSAMHTAMQAQANATINMLSHVPSASASATHSANASSFILPYPPSSSSSSSAMPPVNAALSAQRFANQQERVESWVARETLSSLRDQMVESSRPQFHRHFNRPTNRHIEPRPSIPLVYAPPIYMTDILGQRGQRPLTHFPPYTNGITGTSRYYPSNEGFDAYTIDGRAGSVRIDSSDNGVGDWQTAQLASLLVGAVDRIDKLSTRMDDAFKALNARFDAFEWVPDAPNVTALAQSFAAGSAEQAKAKAAGADADVAATEAASASAAAAAALPMSGDKRPSNEDMTPAAKKQAHANDDDDTLATEVPVNDL